MSRGECQRRSGAQRERKREILRPPLPTATAHRTYSYCRCSPIAAERDIVDSDSECKRGGCEGEKERRERVQRGSERDIASERDVDWYYRQQSTFQQRSFRG